MLKLFKTVLWGNSVALAWTWGIGLFFSVQTAIQFGFNDLLTYCIINASGLALFGIINHFLAKKFSGEEYENIFLIKASKFKFAFLCYQVIAISLTLFALLKYVTLPLGILSVLVCVTFLGAVIFLGEEFSIRRMKYTHLVFGLGVFACLYALLSSDLFASNFSLLSIPAEFKEGLMSFHSQLFKKAYWLPIAIGFAFGPWLDLQHWQRVIQIKKEGLNAAWAYAIGGLIFFGIIFTDGLIALAAFNQDKASLLMNKAASMFNSSSLLFQVKDSITLTLSNHSELNYLLGFYITFIVLACLTTFDSGYVSLKWYLKSLLKDSNSIIFSFLPKKALSSPIPWFVFCAILATTTMHFGVLGNFVVKLDKSLEKFFHFELEYYMAFFAAFFVMYAVTFIRSMIDNEHQKTFSPLKLFATGLCATSIFGIGYFSENTIVMALASLIPLIYGAYTVSKDLELLPPDPNEENNTETKTQVQRINPNVEIMPNPDHQLPEGAELTSVKGCYIKDKWFVHSFIPTYQDTNSVGNVYFAMYAMWVGKTRELFFLHSMPDFDPKTSDFLILTRSYEHKFIRETQEFNPVTIHIRIADYNRKFTTLEHKILNEEGELIGKGKQSLMFVSSKDYGLIDIPDAAYQAFLPYAA